MLSDIKIALRGLAKTPAFTAIAIVTIALAIGANSAVFSLINAVLVRPLPYHNPARLVLLWEQFRAMGLERIPVSAPEYQDLEKGYKGVEQIAGFDYTTFNLAAGGTPERISGAVVSPALFPLLGTEPIAGRTFAREEQGEGHDDVVVISERLWSKRFNSDPSLIGKTLLLNGRSYTVIGVMPKAFEFPIPLFNIQGGQFAERVDIWKPLAFTAQELKSRGSRSYGVIGRLRPGTSVAVAQAELDSIVANWKQLYRDNYDGGDFGAKLYVLQDQVVGSMRTALVILLGAVVFVLLIACANLATMLLARANSRERELAIRVALGAGPWRVLRQLLTESVTLSLAGGIAGLLLSVWALEFLKRVGARTIPRLSEVGLDLNVVGLTVLVSVGTGILFGLIPGWVSATPELTEALKEGGRGSTTGSRRNRIRNSLVVAEIALALVLLVGAGLLMKSFARLQSVNAGFNPQNVLTMEVSLPVTKYPRPVPGASPGPDSRATFFAEALRRINQLPGVEASGATTILPLSGGNSDSSFGIEGRVMKPGTPGPDEEIRTITPDYFRVLQTPLLRGRFFNDGDTATSPQVAIINDALARKYWPNEDPVGKRITFSDTRKPDVKWITIVGLVGGVRHKGLEFDPQPEYYLPHAQDPSRSMLVAVRSTHDPRSLASAIRREIQAVDPELPIANVRTFEAV